MAMNVYQEKKPLLILAGPTAVGKSDFSIKVAKALNGECISADSIQVYQGWVRKNNERGNGRGSASSPRYSGSERGL